MQDKFSVRRLDRASKHVSSLWFPINTEVLRSIRSKIQQATYEPQPEQLFEDLKQDFALFSFVVKELVATASTQNISTDIINNPAKLITWAGPTVIGGFLADDSKLPMNHMLQTISPLQSTRLRETAIIASTAEVLSAHQNLDADTGFSRGIIRETGLNLIAWNYPSLYSRVIKNLTRGQSLDERLSQELGFSPVTLAMRVLHPSTSIVDGDERSVHDSWWDTYDKLCEIGAALARADSPETYPSAENDWNLAKDYLQHTVGEEGIALIRAKAVEHSIQYKQTLSDLFKDLREFNPEQNIQTQRKQSETTRNRYIPQCAPKIQSELHALYTHFMDSHMTGEALETLIRRIIPDAGFTGGCVFLVDPAAFALMPRTVFGTIKLRSVERVLLKQSFSETLGMSSFHRDDTRHSENRDLAATALSCTQPVVEKQNTRGLTGLTGMYASLGDTKKVGVLYLEAPEAPDLDGNHLTMSTFKAMRQALVDALQLD